MGLNQSCLNGLGLPLENRALPHDAFVLPLHLSDLTANIAERPDPDSDSGEGSQTQCEVYAKGRCILPVFPGESNYFYVGLNVLLICVLAICAGGLFCRRGNNLATWLCAGLSLLFAGCLLASIDRENHYRNCENRQWFQHNSAIVRGGIEVLDFKLGR